MADDEQATGLWSYRVTSIGDDEGDAKVQEHLDRCANDGWELINGSSLAIPIVFTPERDGRYIPGVVMSTSITRQYFYWRKRAAG